MMYRRRRRRRRCCRRQRLRLRLRLQRRRRRQNSTTTRSTGALARSSAQQAKLAQPSKGLATDPLFTDGPSKSDFDVDVSERPSQPNGLSRLSPRPAPWPLRASLRVAPVRNYDDDDDNSAASGGFAGAPPAGATCPGGSQAAALASASASAALRASQPATARNSEQASEPLAAPSGGAFRRCTGAGSRARRANKCEPSAAPRKSGTTCGR